MSTGFRKVLISLTILLMVASFTGCWGNTDLSERALIVAVGLDRGEDGNIEFTMQIVNPTAGGTQQSGGEPSLENAVWVHTSKGSTVFEAIRNQFKVSNRRPSYSHIQTIVIGEEMARYGIGDVLDFFERNHETRLTSNVLIAKETTAKKILRIESDLEPIPAVHLQGIINNHEKSGEIQNSRLIDVIRILSNEGIQPTISRIEIVSDHEAMNMHNIRIHGSGVFREDKLIGWLEPEETMGLLYVNDLVKSGIINVPHPKQEGKLIAIEDVRSRVKTDVRIIDEKLQFSIKVDAIGRIAGQQGRDTTVDTEFLQEVERKSREKIKDIISHTVKVAQNEYQCDFLGFGELVHIKYTEYWKQMKEEWPDIFSRVPVNIEVDFNLQRTGRISDPI